MGQCPGAPRPSVDMATMALLGQSLHPGGERRFLLSPCSAAAQVAGVQPGLRKSRVESSSEGNGFSMAVFSLSLTTWASLWGGGCSPREFLL